MLTKCNSKFIIIDIGTKNHSLLIEKGVKRVLLPLKERDEKPLNKTKTKKEIKNMVKITNKSQEFSNLEVYNMTKSHKLNTLKNLEDGAKIEVAGFMEWEDTNEETGEVTELMSLLTTDGVAYVTQSDTFKRDFFDIVEIYDHNLPITIEHGVGKSKAGREYHYCAV